MLKDKLKKAPQIKKVAVPRAPRAKKSSSLDKKYPKVGTPEALAAEADETPMVPSDRNRGATPCQHLSAVKYGKERASIGKTGEVHCSCGAKVEYAPEKTQSPKAPQAPQVAREPLPKSPKTVNPPMPAWTQHDPLHAPVPLQDASPAPQEDEAPGDLEIEVPLVTPDMIFPNPETLGVRALVNTHPYLSNTDTAKQVQNLLLCEERITFYSGQKEQARGAIQLSMELYATMEGYDLKTKIKDRPPLKVGCMIDAEVFPVLIVVAQGEPKTDWDKFKKFLTDLGVGAQTIMAAEMASKTPQPVTHYLKVGKKDILKNKDDE